eukprot:g8907.t1
MSPNKGKMTGLSTPSPLGSPKQTRFAEPQSGDEIVLLVKEPAPSDHDASAAKSRIVTLPGGGGGIVPPASPTSRAPVATMQGNDSDFGMGQRLLRTPPRTPPGVLRTPRTPPDAQPSPTAGGLARVAMSMATPPPTRLRGEGETETGIVSSGGGAAAATFDMRIVEAIQSIGDKLDRSIRDSVDAMAQSLSPSTSPMMRSRIGVAAGEVVEAGKKTSSVLLAGGAKEQNSGAAAASATRRNKGGRNVSLNAGVSSARGGSRTRASKNLRAQQYSVLNESAIPRTREDESMMEVDMTLIDQLNTSNVVAAGSSPPGSMSATQQEGVQRRRASSNGSSNKKESSDKSPGVDMGKKEKAPPDAVDQTFAVAPVSSRGNRYGGRIRANDPDLLALKQAWAPFRLRPLAANRGAAAQQGDQVVVTHGDSPYKKRAGSGSGGGGAVVGYNTNKNVGNNSISPEKKQAWQPDSKPGPTFTEDDKEDGGGFVFYKEANAPSLVIDEGASTSVVVDAIVPQKKVQAVAEQINVNVFEDAQDGDENQNDAQPHVDEQHSPVEPIPSVDSKLFGPLSGSEVAPDGVVGPSVLSNSAEAAALAAASGYSMDEQEGSSSSFEELQDGNIVTPALIESMFSAHTSKSSTITQQPGLGGTAGAAAAKKLAIPEQVVQRLRNRAAAVAAAAERERQRAIEHAEKQALMSGGAPAAPVSVSSSSARANSSGAAGRSSVRGNHATAFGAPNTTSASLRMRSSSATRTAAATSVGGVTEVEVRRRNGGAPYKVSPRKANQKNSSSMLMSTSFQPSASEVKQKQARERREHIQNAQENLLRNRVANQETKREVIEMDRSLLLERARMMASRPGRSRSVGATAKRSPVTPNMSVQDSNFFPWACKSISQTHDSLQLSGVDPR